MATGKRSTVLIRRAQTNTSSPRLNTNCPFYVSEDPDDAVEAVDVANSMARLIFHGLLGKKGTGKGCAITTVIAG